MKPFIDSGIWIGAKIEDDVYHESAKELLLDSINSFDFVYTSIWVLDEVVSYLTKKMSESAPEFLKQVQSSKKINVLDVTNPIIGTAKIMVESKNKYKLTMTDWSNVLLMKNHGIKRIITVDKGFKIIQTIKDFNFYNVDLAWKK